MASGFLGSVLAWIIGVIALLSGAFAVFGDWLEAYHPMEADKKKRLWISLRLACLGSLVILLFNEHSKVKELLTQLEEPVIRLGPVYPMPPEERSAFVDQVTKRANWAVVIPLSTNRKLTGACMWVKEIRGPNSLHITTPRKLGWKHDIQTFGCTDIVNQDSFVLFHTQVAKDDTEHLQLFVQMGAYPGEYTPMIDDIMLGKYQIHG